MEQGFDYESTPVEAGWTPSAPYKCGDEVTVIFHDIWGNEYTKKVRVGAPIEFTGMQPQKTYYNPSEEGPSKIVARYEVELPVLYEGEFSINLVDIPLTVAGYENKYHTGGKDMGTRHLTMVYLDGEYKVAQYGQWDGYPSGQGLTVLRFAHTIAPVANRNAFAERVRSCSFFSDDELKEIDDAINKREIKNWQKLFPQLSRDTGAEILAIINNGPNGIKLQSDLEFAADSLFCEWAWLIDMDAGKLEVYRGFNKKPLTENDRFYFLRDKEPEYHTDTYHAVVLAASWSLDNLPSEEGFLAAFGEDE